MSSSPSLEQKLFRLKFKVRPAPAHPTYYYWQFGVLLVWLFAESGGDAAQKGTWILAQLPYEYVGEHGAVRTVACDDAKPESRDQLHEGFARQVGLSMHLAMCPTGTDEEEFEATEL